jgi:outer membrane lipoprotein-sorting protein
MHSLQSYGFHHLLTYRQLPIYAAVVRNTGEQMLRKVAVGIITLVCAVPAVYAQTVDEIVAKNIEARGGATKLRSLQTSKSTAKLEIQQGMEAPAVEYRKRPNLVRQEFTLQGMTAVQAYDGKQAWGISPFMGKKDPDVLPAEERDEMADQADIDGPLMDYAQKGNKVEFIGKDKLEGTDVYKLKVTLKDGAIETFYIDTDSNLEIRIDSERVVRGTTQKHSTVIGDYKEVDGMPVPHSFESSDADHPEQKMRITLQKVEFNVPVEASLFNMPPKAATTTKGADTTEPKPATPPEKKPDETPKSETPKQ